MDQLATAPTPLLTEENFAPVAIIHSWRRILIINFSDVQEMAYDSVLANEM